MTFKDAVKAAPYPVNGAYCPGTQALENRHRNRVSCTDPRRLTGSIDLDSALGKAPGYANAPRWDYGLGYKPARGREQAVWVEVHAATTSEVRAVLNKLRWLRDWLNAEAGQLRQLTNLADGGRRYVWIASGGDSINRNSRQFRTLSKSGIRLMSRLRLP